MMKIKLIITLLVFTSLTFSQTNEVKLEDKYIQVEGESSAVITPEYNKIVLSFELRERRGFYDSYNETKTEDKIKYFQQEVNEVVKFLTLKKYEHKEEETPEYCSYFSVKYTIEFSSLQSFKEFGKQVKEFNYRLLSPDFEIKGTEINKSSLNSKLDEIYVNALLSAKSKAELAAKTLSFSLGNVLKIQETFGDLTLGILSSVSKKDIIENFGSEEYLLQFISSDYSIYDNSDTEINLEMKVLVFFAIE